jgi:beta-lactamase superfamily II metal-dependent hydrolase
MKKLLCIVALLGIVTTNAQPNVEVGKVLPAWSEGCIDIHLINSGRGECCFYILPDGTTLLVDAGELTDGKGLVKARPNGEIRPYLTYANYIKHFLPNNAKAIDYCLVSHFHIDHTGSIKCATERAEAGYMKTGLLALYDEVPYKHILDRAFPDYTENDVTPELVGQLSKDWATFVRWGIEKELFTAERFTAGKVQIVLRNNPDKYKNFTIFNVCANGFAWGKNHLGKGMLIGGKPERSGNPASCGFHLKYGNFDYMACGDVSWTSQDMTAFYFRDYIGNGKLDAHKANHHLAHNGWGKMLRAFNFDPQVVITPCFASNKPYPEPLAYVLPRTKAFFASNIHPEIAAAHKELVDQIAAYDGHIVLRVMNGGEEFYVYMLDDSDFEYRVKSIHGPYRSK